MENDELDLDGNLQYEIVDEQDEIQQLSEEVSLEEVKTKKESKKRKNSSDLDDGNKTNKKLKMKEKR